MEKSLDATATVAAPAATAAAATPAATTSPVESQTTQSLSMPSQHLSMLSSVSVPEILDQAIRITTADSSLLSEDELLAASLLFTSASEDAIRTARTFIALGNNQVVQHRFLRRQLEEVGLLPTKGKSKSVEDNDAMLC